MLRLLTVCVFLNSYIYCDESSLSKRLREHTKRSTESIKYLKYLTTTELQHARSRVPHPIHWHGQATSSQQRAESVGSRRENNVRALEALRVVTVFF